MRRIYKGKSFLKDVRVLIGFHPRTIRFLQLILILLPHRKSVFACDSIMLPVSASTRVLVQVDIIMNELIRLDVFSDARRYSGMLAGTAGCSPVQRDR